MICRIAASQHKPDLNRVVCIDLDLVAHERTADTVIHGTWKSATILAFIDIGDIAAHIRGFTIRAKEHHPVRLLMVAHKEHSPARIIRSEIFPLLPHIPGLFQFPFEICDRICYEIKRYFRIPSVLNLKDPADASSEFRDEHTLIDGQFSDLEASPDIATECKTFAEIRQPVDLPSCILEYAKVHSIRDLKRQVPDAVPSTFESAVLMADDINPQTSSENI